MTASPPPYTVNKVACCNFLFAFCNWYALQQMAWELPLATVLITPTLVAGHW